MSTDAPEVNEHDASADIAAMVEEISMAVASGLVPFVGQAINVYDTVQSMLTLNNSTTELDRIDAKFDLVLALIGWIPGAGGGVKKTIRIVNKHPDRYAPILFDVLRLVCLKIGIQTSPEALLDKLFDAAGLKAQLGTVQTVIEGSWLYKEMPSEGQMVISSSMTMVKTELAAMVLLVTTKLLHWKKLQRNTAAKAGVVAKKTANDPKPAKHDVNVAATGHNTPLSALGNGTLNAQVGVAVVHEFTNSMTGIVGEHITDYFLYEVYRWGKDWSGHDKGSDGKWPMTPGDTYPGKLNEGTKLNRLFALKAHGTGIDGVWRVQTGDPHNDGKPYAIVESKASQIASKPKNPSRKTGIASRLDDNSRYLKKLALPKTEDLLEPDLANSAGGIGQGAGKPKTPKNNAANQRKPKQAPPVGNSKNSDSSFKGADKFDGPIVQMSQRWISNNIQRAVDDISIANEIKIYRTARYSRHLFYTPFYLPAVVKHLDALRKGEPGKPERHKDHRIPSTHCHGELDVKAAVNQKLEKLGLPLER